MIEETFSPRPSPMRESDEDNDIIEGNNDGSTPADDMNFDEDNDSFEEIDMVEVIELDDQEDDRIDDGDMADVEDEGEGTDEGAVGGEAADLVGLPCQSADYILHPHKGSAVFCSTFDSTGTRLITGGEDDSATFWDSSSLKTQFPVWRSTEHKDSIVSASFNWDSTYFSTCDLSGVVKVWKTNTLECVCTFETSDLSWSFWHFGTNVLFAGCDDGSIYMWKIPSETCKIFSGSPTKCECATLLPDGKRLVAGYSDGTLKMFDLATSETLQTFIRSKSIGRNFSILSIDHHPTRGIIAVGTSNGAVKIYNVQNGKLLHNVRCSPQNTASASSTDGDEEDKQDSVETLAFNIDPTSQLESLAAGSLLGHIVVWDTVTMSERLRLQQKVGLTKLIWNPRLPIIYTASLDGAVRVVDSRTSKIERYFGKHKADVLDLAITKNGDKLMSVSDDGSVFIYVVKDN